METQKALSEINKTEIQKIIKEQKWVKSDYAHAVHYMDHWNAKGFYPDYCLKTEIVAEFWKLIDTKFYMINSFTCFKHITL